MITAAVLAFLQAALVLLATVYVWFLVMVGGALAEGGAPGLVTGRVGELLGEGRVLVAVQVVSALALVAAGILALTRRSRPSWAALVATHAIQVALAAYWALRLDDLLEDALGPGPALAPFALFFAAGPAVALGLVVAGPGRRWFGDRAAAPAAVSTGGEAT